MEDVLFFSFWLCLVFVAEVGYFLVMVQGLLTAEASLVAKRKLSSCGSRVWLPHSTWELHLKGIKLMPPCWQWTLNHWTAREAQVSFLELLLQLSCRFEFFKIKSGQEQYSSGKKTHMPMYGCAHRRAHM